MTLLNFISILLNMICIYFIFHLWKKMKMREQDALTDSLVDVESLLEQFSQDIKEENERLCELIITYGKEHKTASVLSDSNELTSDFNTFPRALFDSTSKESLSDKHTERNKVLCLAEEGYNAEEIAKMLNRGKGEIELLVKFYA